MASITKSNMKVCSNGHHYDSEYDSVSECESEYDYESDSEISGYDSDMSDWERYEKYRSNFNKFISNWKKSEAKPKIIETPKSQIETPIVTKVTSGIIPKKEFSWGVAHKKEVPKLENIIVEEKKNGSDDEWKTVSYKKNSGIVKEKIDVQNRKTKMCESYRNSTECRHGKNCRFAHSGDELQTPICSYGINCSLVKVSSDMSVYKNIHPRKICGRLHPNETDETWYTRATGIAKRATKEEMDAAYYEFIEYLKNPEVSEVPKVQKKTAQKHFYSTWPSSFEQFKEYDIDKLLSIAISNNVQTHYQVKTNKKYVSFRKTENMLFLDLLKFAEKRYKDDLDEIIEFRTMLLKKQEKIRNELNKKKNVVKDIKTLQIREKNLLAIEIRNTNNSIEKNEKTIGRIANIKDNKEFYKKQIEKISCLIKSDKEKLKKLEQRLVDFQDVKKVEDYLKSKEEIKVDKVEVATVKVQEKKQVAVVKKVDDIVLILPSKIVEPVVVVKNEPKKIEVSEPVSEGWTTVSYKKKKIVIIPTIRICESVIKNVPCRHGNKCRFSHEKQVQNIVQPVVKSWSNIVCKTPTTLPSKIQTVSNTKSIHFFNSENVKVKMCDSIVKGVPCRHGKYCRFAHDKKELVLRKCRYGNDCYNIGTCKFAH